MKRRPITPRQVQAALAMYAAATPARVSDTWRIYWPEIEPTVRRYQWPVCLAHVLGEHHAAISAEPVTAGHDTPPHSDACTSAKASHSLFEES